MMINSGVSEEEILNSFEDLNLQIQKETPGATKSEERVEDLLGQPSGKFDYKVFYSKPPSYDIPIESIIPEGWGEEFDDEDFPKEKAVEPLILEQSQQEAEDLSSQHLSKSDDEKQPDEKEACTVTEEMQNSRCVFHPKKNYH